jgi:hypothetical protein
MTLPARCDLNIWNISKQVSIRKQSVGQGRIQAWRREKRNQAPANDEDKKSDFAVLNTIDE